MVIKKQTMNTIQKTDIYTSHCQKVSFGTVAYDFNSTLAKLLDYFKMPVEEVFVRERRINDFKPIFAITLLSLDINYNNKILGELSHLFSRDRIYQWSTIFKQRFINDEDFRNKSIHFFENHLSELTRRNLIRKFKTEEL